MSTGGARDGEFFYVLQDKMRLLLVDDDPILCEFAVVHLSSETAVMQTAPDGARALDILRASPVDLVLLDLEMPEMDGFEVLERVRADARTAQLPVIVVTGREDVRAIDRAYEAGATSFVVKPINWRQLAYQIRYVHRAARAEAASDVALRAFARESAVFMREVLRAAPELGAAVERQAEALARTLGEPLAEPVAVRA
jgi:DNA-binding response OmpR family regulator